MWAGGLLPNWHGGPMKHAGALIGHRGSMAHTTALDATCCMGSHTCVQESAFVKGFDAKLPRDPDAFTAVINDLIEAPTGIGIGLGFGSGLGLGLRSRVRIRIGFRIRYRTATSAKPPGLCGCGCRRQCQRGDLDTSAGGECFATRGGSRPTGARRCCTGCAGWDAWAGWEAAGAEAMG